MSRVARFIFSIAALLVIAGASASVRADTITIVGAGSGQFSTATVVCDFNSQTNTLTFTITNTSAITQPGSTSTITGIGFDLPPLGNITSPSTGLNGFTGTHTAVVGPSDFDFSDGALGNVPANFNNVVLDFGFTTGPSGNFAGGSVEDGLLPGESATFTVSGTAFSNFTEELICNAIFVRFQEVPLAGNSGGSDVGVPGNPIPEPSSILLLGSALVGLGGYARKKFKTRN